MDRLREDQQPEIEITKTEGLILQISRDIAGWLSADAHDAELLINSLLPVEEGETFMRFLTIAELDINCWLKGIQLKLQEIPPTALNVVEIQIQIALYEAVRNCFFGLPSVGFDLSPGQTHYWGLRRYRGQAAWVKRPPSREEEIHAAIIKLHNPE